MQTGPLGTVGTLVQFTLHVVAAVLRIGTKVALRLRAAAVVMGIRQLIRLLAMEIEVRDIAYFTRSKITEMCAYFIISIIAYLLIF